MAAADTPARRLAHTREVTCQGFIRDDGLVDVEARLTDLSPEAAVLRFRTLQAGDPIHDLRLVMTIDQKMLIHRLRAYTDTGATPYCTEGDRAYASMEGVRIGPGFRRELRQRVGGVKGCTHLTELMSMMAMTAVQTVLGLLRDRGEAQNYAHVEGKAHWIIDTCHAYRADGDAVRMLMPRSRKADRAAPQDQQDGQR